MRADEYNRMDHLEESLWWFSGLHSMVLTLLQRHANERHLQLLDAGCGTGGMLKVIVGRFPGATVAGLDYSESACSLARKKTSVDIRCGSVNHLPYPDGAFDVIVSLDVLGSDGVDPHRAVAEFRRTLRPDGLLILNLAAYQWMLSYHDKAVGQSRRFSRRDVNALLDRNDLRRLQGTYWNTFLFPFMVLRRKVLRAGDAGSDVRPFPGPVDAVFRRVVALEAWLIGKGITLPFGGSVLAVARKVTR